VLALYNMTEYSSNLIDTAVNELSRLPGIGKKTALRLVLHLLKRPVPESENLGNAIIRLRKEIQFCNCCYNVSDDQLCLICQNPLRNKKTICVVENIRDVIAIERTNQYKGVYHVLGGVISPMDGIGPELLKIDQLLKRINKDAVEEIIMALNPTMDGDTTIFYLSQKIEHLNIKLTTLARGVAFGGDLEYVDELTLARSLATRTNYENYLIKD